MNAYEFSLGGATLLALGSGALYWPARGLLCVSDLHLGRAGRLARLGAGPLPPYEGADTLARLDADLRATCARVVVCLGDSFDDGAAAALPEEDRLRIAALQAGRRWVWIAGNHDPGPVEQGGTHMREWRLDPLVFRHIARPGQAGEVSGHYHPKATLRPGGRTVSRPAFLIDGARVVMPAYGTYTGGLRCDDPALAGLMSAAAVAVLTGPVARPVPMPGRPGTLRHRSPG